MLAPSQGGSCGNDTGNTTMEGLVCFLCGKGFNANPFLGFLANVLTRQDDLDSKLHHKKSPSKIILTDQFRPKIFFAPNTSNVTLSIIKRANRTFAAIGDFNDALDKGVNCSDEFKRRVPPYSPQAARLNVVSAENLCYLLLLLQTEHDSISVVCVTYVRT